MRWVRLPHQDHFRNFAVSGHYGEFDGTPRLSGQPSHHFIPVGSSNRFSVRRQDQIARLDTSGGGCRRRVHSSHHKRATFGGLLLAVKLKHSNTDGSGFRSYREMGDCYRRDAD